MGIFKKEVEPINQCGRDNCCKWQTKTNEISISSKFILLNELDVLFKVDWKPEYIPIEEILLSAYEAANGSKEELLAKILITLDLPVNVEDLVIMKFNSIKKLALQHRDKVLLKTQKILRSYQ